MCSVINANTQSIDQLAAKPSCDAAERESYDLQQRQIRGWGGIGRVSSHQPDEREDQDDDDVGAAVEEPDALRSCAGGNREPINQPEYRCEQTTHDAPSNVPV